VIRWMLAALWLATPALAQIDDWVVIDGKLSDEDFYRLVACGAPPGGACLDDAFPVWPNPSARALRISLMPAEAGVGSAYSDQVSAALDQAIAEINGVGSGLNLIRADGARHPHVRVFITTAGNFEPISGTGIAGIDGAIMGGAQVTLWWDGSADKLYDAVIVMAGDLTPGTVLPIMLEELTQAMGFLFDIRSDIYADQSVFSEDSNSVRELGVQDRMVLRRAYPPLPPAAPKEN
jgi:hypothetical protein